MEELARLVCERTLTEAVDSCASRDGQDLPIERGRAPLCACWHVDTSAQAQ